MNIATGKKFQFDNIFDNPLDFKLLRLYQIGELCCEPTFQVPSHKQWCYEISYIISGTGLFYTNGLETPVSAGELIITPKNALHSITASPTEALSFAYLGFDFDLSRVTMENENLVAFYNCPKKEKAKDITDIYPIINRCIDEFYRSPQDNNLTIESYLNLILILTKRSFENTLPIQRLKESHISNSIVYLMIRYIDKNIFTLSDIRTMAADIGYSSCYLSHLFKESAGITLQQYLNNKKIEKSIELLMMDRFSITVIAEKLNYTTVQSFSRAFKRTTGLYPSQYLKNYQK